MDSEGPRSYRRRGRRKGRKRREKEKGKRKKERRRKKIKKGARRGTLFIQEASAAAISHRLDSDRFEPLYAYRLWRQCPSESSLRSPSRGSWGIPAAVACSGRPWPAPGFTSNCPGGEGRKLFRREEEIPSSSLSRERETWQNSILLISRPPREYSNDEARVDFFFFPSFSFVLFHGGVDGKSGE